VRWPWHAFDPAANRRCWRRASASCSIPAPNGQWSYGASPEGAQPALGDNSNTAYALLALAACHKAGIDVPRSSVEKAEAWWRSAQHEDGGWGYRTDREQASYASMTESGISSLLLCRNLIAREGGSEPELDRGRGWLSAHLSVSENTGSAYQQGRLLYHLYALERVGSLFVSERAGGHDWYGEGAARLLSSQNSDGSWDDGADTPIPNTCFALLFLTRSSAFLR
jgi:hypothetical protein